MDFLSDEEITSLIGEQKQMTVSPEELLRNMKSKRGHMESEHIIQRGDGSSFVIKIRLSQENHLDFSVILGFNPPKSNKLLRLRRYNGKSHEHKNKLEKESPFYDFHIHTATERYQREGTNEEYFAEVTDRYSSIYQALNCLISDCNLVFPPGAQTTMEF
jgi:hypothetical protein